MCGRLYQLQFIYRDIRNQSCPGVKIEPKKIPVKF